MTLELAHVTQRYSGRKVLDDVSIAVAPGRVHALVGENGAGKSTLIRVACGLARPDAGTVSVDGRTVSLGDARDAAKYGIGVVHQHFMLIEPMSVAENVALGAEPRRGLGRLFVDRESVRRTVRELAKKYVLDVDPDARIETLSVGERQRVELIKVLSRGARYVLLDEPTAVLSPNEIASLLDMIRSLAKAGAGVLFVSHKLDEVFAVADEITVLRRGRRVLDVPRGETDAAAIAEAVVGGEVPNDVRREHGAHSGEGLRLDAVVSAGVGPVTLHIAPGEIVGVVGVEGNGQKPLAHAIAGLAPIERGVLSMMGEAITHASVDARRRAGLGYVPEDREGSGLFPQLSVRENLALGEPSFALRAFAMISGRTREQARAAIERFEVRPPDPEATIGSLSGGNAQKVLIARELDRSLRALVIAQPTRGIDLGAAVRVHTAIRDASERGVAVLLVSSDLDEIRRLADRVVVMRRGAIVAVMPVDDATDARLGPLMIGDDIEVAS